MDKHELATLPAWLNTLTLWQQEAPMCHALKEEEQSREREGAERERERESW